MVTHPDTIATVVGMERGLALQRAERRARVLDAIAAPRSVRVDRPARATTVGGSGLARAIRSLRWILRPAYA